MIATTEAFDEAIGPDGERPLLSRLVVENLDVGAYVIMVEGPVGAYQIAYAPFN